MNRTGYEEEAEGKTFWGKKECEKAEAVLHPTTDCLYTLFKLNIHIQERAGPVYCRSSSWERSRKRSPGPSELLTESRDCDLAVSYLTLSDSNGHIFTSNATCTKRRKVRGLLATYHVVLRLVSCSLCPEPGLHGGALDTWPVVVFLLHRTRSSLLSVCFCFVFVFCETVISIIHCVQFRIYLIDKLQ